jgi:predicted DNA binding protein
MAKKNNEPEVNQLQYQIGKKILLEGYYGIIDGKEFIVAGATEEETLTPDGKKTKKRIPGCVAEKETVGEDIILKRTGKRYFEDLSDKQLKTLANAGVIELTKEQADKYKSLL